MKKKYWYDYLWIVTILYFTLGFFNILFAWLGMIMFILPLLFAIIGGNKLYCNKYCDRSRLFELLGGRFSLNMAPPPFLRSTWFRYGFLAFFLTMFGLMVAYTYQVFTGAPLRETVTLLWTFKLGWSTAGVSSVTPWVAQYAYGFYGVMLTSLVLGLATRVLYRPRSWCVYCPMGTMTQGICKIKHRNDAK
ncbi:MAG: 4Fe-4S binding protein [Deferribacteraceae bacterium]|jgi:hypothetical protein|nr:4Fe-4S binding protein [Deferribacteraceae bacterium]